MISKTNALLDQSIVSGSNFFIVMIAARFLPAEDVGRYGYACALYMIVFMLAYALIYQNIAAIDDKKLKYWANNYIWFNLILSTIMIPIILFIFYWLSKKVSDTSWIEAFLVTIFVFITQSIDFCRRILYFHNDLFLLNNPAYISIVGFAIRVPTLILLHPNSFKEMMSIIVFISTPALLIYFYALAVMRPSQILTFIGTQFRAGGWMIANIPINWAWGQAPVFLVGSCLGIESAGVYAAIRAIANLPNVVLEMVPTFFASRLRSYINEKTEYGYRNYLLNLLMLGLIVGGGGTIILLSFSDDIVRFILGEIYEKYSLLLVLFWLFMVLLFFIKIQFVHLRFIEKTFIAPIAHLIGLGALSIVFYLLAPFKGVVSMGWAQLTGAVAIIILQLYASRMGIVRCPR